MARNKTTKPSGAELRALRDQRATADPTQEAQQREASFLANLSRAQSDFEWLAEHQAWILLGFASLAEWWEGRVRPVLDALALRPGPEMAQRVIEMILAAEAALPAPQRRSKKAVAALVGASEWKAYGREDHRQRRSTTRSDHEQVGGSDGPNPDTDPEGPVQTPLAGSSTPTAAVESMVDDKPADGVEGVEHPPVDTPASSGDGEEVTLSPEGVNPEDSPVASGASASFRAERTGRDEAEQHQQPGPISLTGQPHASDMPEGELPTATGQSGTDHPSGAGEAPADSGPSASGAGATPSDVLDPSGDETAGGPAGPGPSAVDPTDLFAGAMLAARAAVRPFLIHEIAEMGEDAYDALTDTKDFYVDLHERVTAVLAGGDSDEQ